MGLKDALTSLGLRSSKGANERAKKARGRAERASEKHQRARTFCEVCEGEHGDVEYYKHKNPVLADSRWICLACADKNEIDDATRTSRQSELSRAGGFKRFYGATRSVF